MQKFIKRNRAGVITASLVGVALILGVIGTSLGMWSASVAAANETKQRVIAEQNEQHYKGQKEYQTILENAELYIQDAEKFLEDGQDEVAILSIGYADGLVDALRLAKGFDPKM